MPAKFPRRMTPSEAQAEYGVSQSDIYAACVYGRLPCEPPSAPGDDFTFAESAFLALIASRALNPLDRTNV